MATRRMAAHWKVKKTDQVQKREKKRERIKSAKLGVFIEKWSQWRIETNVRWLCFG